MSRLFSDILPEWPLDAVEEGLASATETDVLSALELAANGRRLSARDFMALLSPAASLHLETMARIARDVTIRQFGRSIQLFTPLYLANYCTNQCVYCGFNTKNHIHRSMLTMEEVESEGKAIAATGLRNILLLTGDAPRLTGPAYIAEAARRLRPYFPSIGVEVYSMSEDEYRMLVDAGVDSFTMFQETYNEELYLKLHPAGPKRDFRFRLNAPDRAARAGMRSVNVGALLGLDQWRRDAFYTGLHADWIQAAYPGVDIAVSAPRMRPFPRRACVRMRVRSTTSIPLPSGIWCSISKLSASICPLRGSRCPRASARSCAIGSSGLASPRFRRAFPPPWAGMPTPRRMPPGSTIPPSLRLPTTGMWIR